MTTTFKLIVPGNFNNLARIADFIDQAAAQTGLNDKAGYAIKMAVDEACTNIIEHAYGGEGRGEIELTCRIKENGLQVIITDQGLPFDPNQVTLLDPQTPLNQRQRRGMGMFFIYNLVDEVDYKFNTPRGNQLTLFKKRG